MNRASWMILGVVSLLVGVTSGLLAYWKGHQRLGEPGVKVVAQSIHNPDGDVVGTNSVYLPDRVAGYSSSALPISDIELELLPPDTTFGRRLYAASNGLEMMFSVVLMGTDRSSIHRPQYCLEGQGWKIDPERSGQASIRIERPHSYDLPVRKIVADGVMRAADGRRVPVTGIYVYWFVADNELTDDHFGWMSSMARNLIRTGVLQRWAYASCLATCTPGREDETFEQMKRLIAAIVPDFQGTIGEPSRSSAAELKSMP